MALVEGAAPLVTTLSEGGSRASTSPAPILAHRMRRRFTPTRPDCRRRSSKSAATKSCSTIQYAWRSGCQVELEKWPRMPHTWQVWARVLPEARAAIERIGAFVQSKM
jgi:hypothetical protein